MKILSIETSSNVCAVALLEDNKNLKEIFLDDKNTHSVKLMPLIEELLELTNTQLEEIELFAVDKGPGSFTGIRIGIATVKAFMDAKNKKGIGISSLEGLAYNVDKDGYICSIIDAKNDNIYYGLFEKKENKIIECEKKDFSNIKELLEKLKNENKKIIFVGNAVEIHKEIIKEQLKENAQLITDENINKLNARNIGLAAFYNRENAGDSNSIIPTYLRKSNAERIDLKK